MSNNTCPICSGPTRGKPVRGVHFCEKHRELALQIRDDPAFAGEGPMSEHVLIKRVRAHAGITTREVINEILPNVTAGTLLRVTFKPEAPTDLMYLLGMLKDGFIATTEMWDESGITAVALSRKWEFVKRTFVFRIVRWGETELDWFKGRLGRAIEDIAIQQA